MLSRRFLATAALAAGLTVTAAVPALAATPAATTSATSSAPAATPTAAASSAPGSGAGPAKVVEVPGGCAIVVPGGRKIIRFAPTTTAANRAAICKQLLARELARPFPKGAPETGGGAMAAEVSTWR